MQDISKFTEYYIPDNHWLSKSMEITRLEYGTYWYMKKMMVYYYYVFILKKLEENEIIEITRHFKDYIKSLPDEAQKEAEEFFFKRDIRNTSSIITFNEFTMTKGYKKDKDILDTNKYYYSYLMGLEPQNENKEIILDNIISSRNFFEGREKARTELIKTKNEKEIKGFEGDVHSFLRNERQLLFMMGLFNYTDTNQEEYTPTSVGIAVVYANFNELILLLEIQKLKQVSRNPLVYYAMSIDRPRNRSIKDNVDLKILDNVDIKSSPYLLYLNYLLQHKEINNNEYKYLISRSTDKHDEDYIINFDTEDLEDLKEKVILKDSKYITPGSNNNSKDIIGPEDFSKEHKKYQVGIIESEKDYKSNLFSVAKRLSNRKIEVNDENKLKVLIDYYEDITEYIHNNDSTKELFLELKKGHKDKYSSHLNKTSYQKDSRDHIQLVSGWLQYFVSIDRELIRMMVVAVSKANNLSDSEILKKFPYLCNKHLGFKSSTNIFDILNTKTSYEKENPIIEPIVIPGLVTIKGLEEESKKYLLIKDDFRKDRARNIKLISMYLNWLQRKDHSKCEICEKEFEYKDNGNPICNIHHIIPFKEDEAFGPDHYLNLLALCLDCHGKVHSIRDGDKLKEMYDKVECNSALNKSVKSRIDKMYEEDYLFPTSLRYAFGQGMITQEEEKEIARK